VYARNTPNRSSCGRRKWAEASREDAKTLAMIASELTRHFVEHPVFPDLEHVPARFLYELRQI